MLKRLCLWVLSLVIWAVPAIGWANQYRAIDLGSLGGSIAVAYGINDRGQVVGESGSRAFIWDEKSGIRDLGTDSTRLSRAFHINNLGQVVGGCYSYNSQFQSLSSQDAYVRQPDGEINYLRTLPGETNLTWSVSINDSGMAVGTTYAAPYAPPYYADIIGVRWNTLEDTIEASSLGRGFIPVDVNDNGQVVGHYKDSGGNWHVLLWEQESGCADTGLSVPAHAINNRGQIIGGEGGWYVWDSATRKILYTGDGYGNDISDDGHVVGYFGGSDSTDHAFVWDPVGGLVDLGADARAYGINEHGSIVGQANVAGEWHAFMWTPVPEPSSVVVVACGFIGISGRLLRGRRKQT